jgi:hypothetical protein
MVIAVRPVPCPLPPIGWRKLRTTRQYHFFDGWQYSACGHWFYTPNVEQLDVDHTVENTCIFCMRKVKYAKRRKAQGTADAAADTGTDVRSADNE